MKRVLIALTTGLFMIIICFCHTPPGWTALEQSDFEKIAEAVPDECFIDIGERKPMTDPNCRECGEGAIPKTNQTYIWSLTGDEDKIWFGTLANGACQVLSVAMRSPFQMGDTITCEFFSGPQFSDWRPAQIWSYDKQTGDLKNHSITNPLDPLYHTMGWRAATVYKDKVFFAGPNRFAQQALHLLIMDKDGNQLEKKTFLRYKDARKFLVGSDGRLYLGVSKEPFGGAVLQWDEEKKFFWEVGRFFEAGKIWREVAWVEEYKEHLYAITWGGDHLLGHFQIWKSPHISKLSPLRAFGWKKIWDYGQYTGRSWFLGDHAFIGGGPMCAYNGYLYFGTMTSLVGPLYRNPPTPPANLFRLKDEDGEIKVELLIGKAQNGFEPLLDPNDFAEFYHEGNTYIWNMAIHDGLLYIGTLNLLSEGMPEADTTGFHLWETSGGTDVSDWKVVTSRGFRNPYNYGCRQLFSDGQSLWVGTANLGNLGVDSRGRYHRGWELWKGDVPATENENQEEGESPGEGESQQSMEEDEILSLSGPIWSPRIRNMQRGSLQAMGIRNIMGIYGN